MKNPLQTIMQFSPHKKRNAFDLSYRNVFSMPVGAIIPFFVNDAQPGDHWELNVSDEVRAINMNSMNFTRLTMNMEYYFVPYRLLWRWWPQFITQVNDSTSRNFGNSRDLPSGSNYQISSIAAPRYAPSVRQQDVLSAFSDSSAPVSTDDMGYPFKAGVERLLTSLQIGRGWLFSTLDANTAGTSTSSYWSSSVTGFDSADFPNLNLFRLLAYQKIYQDWFRNTDYETVNAVACNIDNFKGDTAYYTPDQSPSEFFEWFTLRYAKWPLDRFTSLKPSINYVGNPSLSLDNSAFFTGGSSTLNNTIVSFPGDISSSYSFSSLSSYRNAYALEKLSMVTNRAAKYYSQQMQARWGEKVNSHDDNRCYKIGGTAHSVGTKQVVSNAETSEGTLGQLGAFGSGSAQKNKFTYDVTEHGVIIGVAYCMPYADYYATGLSLFNQKFTRNDYFQPEFDNLGMQPLYAGQMRGAVDVATGGNYDPGYNLQLGWQNRYMEYKSAADVIDPAFANNYKTWSTPRTNPFRSLSSAGQSDFMRFFHIDPASVNNMFVSVYNGYPVTDQLLVNCMNNVTAVRNMSVDGTPLAVMHLHKD